MENSSRVHILKGFFLRIILPTFLVITLFVFSIFFFIIPAFKNNLIESKKAMTSELANTVWSILEAFEKDVQKGEISKAEAQRRALTLIQSLRYGQEKKDYFWVTDMVPQMLMHPYRIDLMNTDISEYTDSEGKTFFSDAVHLVKSQNEGYIDYMWQWKDDPARIVPKTSYVKGFAPWGWIVGTGIYIEDVNDEISTITSGLIKIALAIILATTFLLVFIAHQSLKIERVRQHIEHDLIESKERYRLLVEASTDGEMIVLNNRFIYANKSILEMLEYTQDEFLNLDIGVVFDASKRNFSNVHTFGKFLKYNEANPELETQVFKKDGLPVNVLLISSSIMLTGKQGFVVIAKDMSSHRRIKVALDQSQEKYNTLISSINTGVFRTTIGPNSKFMELNQAARNMFFFESDDEIKNTNALDFFFDLEERKRFVAILSEDGFIKDQLVLLKKGNGSVSINSISAVLVKDADGKTTFCDGIIEDITEQKKDEELKEELIRELQAALLFLNEPITEYVRDIIHCDMAMSIRDVAVLMTRNKYSNIIVKTDTDSYIGIVTDRDFKERAIAENIDMNTPVSQIMTSPLILISDRALIYDAILKMHDRGVKHLAVRNSNGTITSVLSYAKLLDVQRHSSSFLIKEISNAYSIDEIKQTYNRLPLLVKAMVDSGVKAKNITRIITGVSDAILSKAIGFAVKELGPFPAEFAFLALGSEGRKEQTLITDQDNAIIYEDVPEDSQEKVQEYFLEFADKVCSYLNHAGYAFCKGDVMAKNPKWCQSLSTWKEYFSDWIDSATPQDLMRISIFFDLRCVYGAKDLTVQLRNHVGKTSNGRAAFFQNMALNALLHKPPLGFLGNIVVASSGDHPDTFNIKSAIMPISTFARVYALQNQLEETNTLDRIHRLYEKKVFTKTFHDEAVLVYNFLMNIRFKHQSMLIFNNLTPDNYINPKDLTSLETLMLKKTLQQVSDFQSKLSFDFTGLG